MGFLAALALAPQTAQSGPAIGQFEVKDLDIDLGAFEFQFLNAISLGAPDRSRTARPGESEPVWDDNTIFLQRHALEAETALTSFLRARIGVEFERERIEDPASAGEATSYDEVRLDEIGLEAVAVLIPVERHGIGLGALVEYERPFVRGETQSILFGPIVEAVDGAWSGTLNVMLVHAFGGQAGEDEELPDHKWDLAYAATVAYDSGPMTYALEAYGTFDRIGDTGTPGAPARLIGDHDHHRAGPVLYWRQGGEDDRDRGTWTLGAGLLAGLTSSTPAATLKLSLEAEY